MAKQYVKLGAILKSKDGNLYIKVDRSETSKLQSLNINGKVFNGEYINLEKPRDKYDRMLEMGKITEKEHAAKVESIPKYVKYELTAVLE